MWSRRPSKSYDLDHLYKLSSPSPWRLHMKFGFDWPSGVVQFRPYCQVWRLGPLDLTHMAQRTFQPRHSLSKSYVHGFLGLTSTKQGVNVTCSRPQRTATRPGLEPGTPWSIVRDTNHCASPPPPPLFAKGDL